jgi:membrane associated rhomboid family serine protease
MLDVFVVKCLLQSVSRPVPERYASAFRVFFPTGRLEVGWLTLALLVACLAVTILTDFGTNLVQVNHFSITRYGYVDGIHVGWQTGLPEICHGEIWRLFTPIFIHFAFSHIFYNALWILIFGTLIEKRQGTWVLALLVIVTASLSGLAQYAVHGPAFGGISGVVCGLLGYIWTRDMFDPGARLRLDRAVLILGICSCLLGCIGIFAHLGQMIHVAGLFTGMVMGTVSGLWAKR